VISLRDFDILEKWSLTGGGRLQDLVTKGGSTLLEVINIWVWLKKNIYTGVQYQQFR